LATDDEHFSAAGPQKQLRRFKTDKEVQ
jgi:hypothetical protein